jgi:hypothetical protein
MRYAIVTGGLNATLEVVRDYLPNNYTAEMVYNQDHPRGVIFIKGTDDHGWTLDGYVIPRLASGLIAAKEVTQ